MSSLHLSQPDQKVIFPKPDTYFYLLMNHKGKELPRTYKWFKRLNKYFVIPLYRLRVLPLFGAGWLWPILMITVIGRRTSKTRRNPLEFHRINDIIYITAALGERTDWVRNIRANPDKVKVQVGFRSFHTKVEIIDDIAGKVKYIEWMITNIPREAKMGFGWDPKEDSIEHADFTPLAKFLTVIQLHKSIKTL